MARVIDEAVAALRAGKPVVLPTDTVYGLCANPYRSDVRRAALPAEGARRARQPTALVASDLDMLFECVPELRGRSGRIARALLPGPYTLVLPNPARRFRWLTGARPDTIGVRVPELAGAGADVLERVGAVAATSANLPGGPGPRRLEDVPGEIRAAARPWSTAASCPGRRRPSIDFTGDGAGVLREGAVPAADALAVASRSGLGCPSDASSSSPRAPREEQAWPSRRRPSSSSGPPASPTSTRRSPRCSAASSSASAARSS